MPRNFSQMKFENSSQFTLKKKKLNIKPSPEVKKTSINNVFAGGMVNRIAYTPAGCGSCGGAR